MLILALTCPQLTGRGEIKRPRQKKGTRRKTLNVEVAVAERDTHTISLALTEVSIITISNMIFKQGEQGVQV